MKSIPALCQKTVAELCALLNVGETTSRSIVAAYLESIALRDGEIHAYLEVFSETALEEAALSDTRRRKGQPLSPLDGIPIAVKDNLVMKGQKCTCASRMLEGFVSPYDATVITKIKAAGMPILGRLNMDEFAMGGSTETSFFGQTKNPWNLGYVPGGSSGGSAAAVAAGMAPLALGSDTGGSIRQPAGFCGVTGVKPAYGTVSRYGLVAFASSFDQIGPLAKTAGDAAILMNVIAGEDPRDATSDGALAVDFTETTPLRGKVLGMPKECFGQGLADSVRQALMKAADHFRNLGVEVRDISMPTLPHALSAYYVISSAEASSNLARFDGIRYGYRAQDYADLDELYRKTRQEGFGLEVKRRIMLGAFALSSGYQDQYYLKAQAVRRWLTAEAEEALISCDALLCPVAPTPAYSLGAKTASPMEMYLGDMYTVPANITGLPALSIPCGTAEGGLPIGMGLMGGRHSLAALLGMARMYEQRYPVSTGQHPYDQVEPLGKAAKGGDVQ